MKDRRARVALTVPPEIKKIYDDVADSMGIPTSKLILQIMTEAAPAIKKMGLAVEKAKSEPFSSLHDLSSMLDEGSKQIDRLQMDIEEQIKKK